MYTTLRKVSMQNQHLCDKKISARNVDKFKPSAYQKNALQLNTEGHCYEVGVAYDHQVVTSDLLRLYLVACQCFVGNRPLTRPSSFA